MHRRLQKASDALRLFIEVGLLLCDYVFEKNILFNVIEKF